MAECGVAAVSKEVVQLVGPIIKRQFTYLCCFTSHISRLRYAARQVEDEAAELQGRVDRERDDLHVIEPQVESWLRDANYIKDQTNTILEQAADVRSGCLNLRARYSLSRMAKKTTDRMRQLQREHNFMVTLEFETRRKVEDVIMTALREGDINMIGIYGIGGVGKTAMARRIVKKVSDDVVFAEVVMAIVGQQVDKSQIQYEIGEQLYLNLKEESLDAARAQKLHAKLSERTKTLLVLDDVWERLDLKDLGIPHDSKWCTILLTSRNRDVLHEMNVQKTFEMPPLSSEESWFLFRNKVGTFVDDPEFNVIAKEIVEECRGLPIALTIIGATLRNQRNVFVWRDALRNLRQLDSNIPYEISGVYNLLRRSYDLLRSEAQSLFLLCCLFPEDANIPIEKLVYFCMGLGIFEGIRDLEEVRNRTWALSKMLKSRSLLLDGDNEDEVRMHDVVRDFCIIIAKEKGYIGGNDCTWISSFLPFNQSELPTHLGFPNLRLFLSSPQFEEEFNLDSAFLERIRDVSVLCIHNYSFTSLPHTLRSLTNLNTLVLDSCEELKTISVVRELENLEILICRGCGSLEELAPEIKGLNRLKSLVVTEGYSGLRTHTFTSLPHTTGSPPNLNTLVLDSCEKLHTISVNLEILIYRNCNFIEELPLEIKGKELEYTRCSSTSLPLNMQSTRNLNSLVLDSCEKLRTISAVVKELVNLESLVCRKCDLIEELPQEIKGLNRLKLFELTGCSGLQRIGRGIISSLVGLEELKMLESFKKWEAQDREGGNACLKELEELTKLRCLEIEIEDPAIAAENMKLSSEMERFDIRISEGFGAHHERFDKKLSLRLEKEICLGDWILRDTESLYLYGNGANNVDLAKFQKIKALHLGKCNTMKNIVTSVNADVFSSIEFLDLFSLDELEDIWDTRNQSISLQNLKELHLRDLPALQIWKSGQNHYAPLFPNLSSIEISNCPHLRNLGQESVSYCNLRALQETVTPPAQEVSAQQENEREEPAQGSGSDQQVTSGLATGREVVDRN